MTPPLVILGAGLSGLAAGIRHVRFGLPTVVVEQHTRPGGLNSYYRRQGFLLETGLHAMTNYAPPGDKRAPLNRLFRQLKLKRASFAACEQRGSVIHFPDCQLRFSNDITELSDEIAAGFPAEADGFAALVERVRGHNPFTPAPWRSARRELARHIHDPLLADMLLCPLMIYGSANEDDMDFSQFVIMFNAVYLEGFFRPRGTIKDLLDLLVSHYQGLGGELRLGARARAVRTDGGRVTAVLLDNGEELPCSGLVSTIGAPNTLDLLPGCLEGGRPRYEGRLSFMESIFMLEACKASLPRDVTCVFFNLHRRYRYRCPDNLIDAGSGVVNFPGNFHGLEEKQRYVQVRLTNPANHALWAALGRDEAYGAAKKRAVAESTAAAAKIIGNFAENSVYQDTFTPVTIERFTGKARGAVYGSPVKIKDGRTRYENLFVAGTDQGYLGIVGAMLSGVTIVNQHVLR